MISLSLLVENKSIYSNNLSRLDMDNYIPLEDSLVNIYKRYYNYDNYNFCLDFCKQTSLKYMQI